VGDRREPEVEHSVRRLVGRGRVGRRGVEDKTTQDSKNRRKVQLRAGVQQVDHPHKGALHTGPRGRCAVAGSHAQADSRCARPGDSVT
jgi:hypothetical protein